MISLRKGLDIQLIKPALPDRYAEDGRIQTAIAMPRLKGRREYRFRFRLPSVYFFNNTQFALAHILSSSCSVCQSRDNFRLAVVRRRLTLHCCVN